MVCYLTADCPPSSCAHCDWPSLTRFRVVPSAAGFRSEAGLLVSRTLAVAYSVGCSCVLARLRGGLLCCAGLEPRSFRLYYFDKASHINGYIYIK